MRICFVVDYRSPIARNWIQYVVDHGHEVHVISTHPVEQFDSKLAGFASVPIGFARLRANATVRRHFAASRGQSAAGEAGRTSWVRQAMRGVGTRMLGAYEWIAPFELLRYADQVRRIVQDARPQLVHAMRIPFEGMLAATALDDVDVPLLVSVWGNDFTLHAARVPTVAVATKGVLARCNALHADCARDVRLAARWGLAPSKPTVVIPSSGGIRRDIFRADHGRSNTVFESYGVAADSPVVINPRGFRPKYVRNDVFFASIPRVLERVPNAVFAAVGMGGHPVAERWVRKYAIQKSVLLLPAVPHSEMAALFSRAAVTVSPAIHDGTPNTLLEAMACGAFPVAGNIESVREWIEHGKNGLLCDPSNAEELAEAIIEALSNPTLRDRARSYNYEMIQTRAEYQKSMQKAEKFYASLIRG